MSEPFIHHTIESHNLEFNIGLKVSETNVIARIQLTVLKTEFIGGNGPPLTLGVNGQVAY